MPPFDITTKDGKEYTIEAATIEAAQRAATENGLIPAPPSGGANQRTGEFATGINDALAGLVGLPMDASAYLGNKFGQGVNYLTGSEIFTPRPTIGGSEQIKRGLEATVGRTEPTDTTGRLIYGAGQGVGGAVGGAGLGLGLRAAGAAPAIADALIGGNTAGQQAVNAGLGLASGVGEAAGQEVGGPVGGVIGGLAAPLVPVGAYAAGGALRNRIGATPRAARELQGAAGDAAARQTAIDRLGQEITGPFPERAPGSGDVMAPGEIIPGSLPSTSQITGNTGIGDLERRLITQMPATADQRTAQQNQLWSLADTQRTAREDFRAGMGSGVPVEERGDLLRAPVLSSMDRDRSAASNQFETIDPGKTATFDATPIKTTADGIYKNMAPTEVSMSESEKKIFDFVRLGGTDVPFGRWQTTRRDLLAEMAKQRGEGNGVAVNRMGDLLTSVEDTMAAAATKGGNLPPEVAQRYREAADSWRQYKETYQDNPYVGPLVERTPRNALEMQRADVPRQVLQNADSAQAYLKAGGDPEQLRTTLVDELAERLPGDKLTPRSFFNWLGTRDGALRAAGLNSDASGLNAVRQLQAEFERPLPPGSTMTGRATQRTATTVASKVGDAFRKGAGMIGSGTGAVIGSSAGPVGTFIGAVAPPILNALQKAGINSKDKLLARAAVDPDFARLLLMRETPDNAPLIARGFEAWGRTGIGGAAYSP